MSLSMAVAWPNLGVRGHPNLLCLNVKMQEGTRLRLGTGMKEGVHADQARTSN